MSRLATASRIKVQCAKALNYRMRPIDVISAIDKLLTTTVQSRIMIAAPARFKVGDLIRVSKLKTIFEKSYIPNWTTEVFRVTEMQKTIP